MITVWLQGQGIGTAARHILGQGWKFGKAGDSRIYGYDIFDGRVRIGGEVTLALYMKGGQSMAHGSQLNLNTKAQQPSSQLLLLQSSESR